MDLVFLVGNIATLVTVASSFAGLPTCLDIAKRKSTSGVSCLPFLTAVINCSLWLHYGVTVKDMTVTMVNFIALFLQSCYLINYYYISSDKATLSQMLVPTAVALLSVHGYALCAASREQAAGLLGILSCCGSIVVSAAPLAGIKEMLRNKSTASLPFLIIFGGFLVSLLSYSKEVFRSKSTASLPFLIIFGGFLVSLLWFLYGLLVNDLYIQVPNFIAATISGFQLSLFLIYDSKPAGKKFD